MWKVIYDYFLMNTITSFVILWSSIALIMLSRTFFSGVYHFKEYREAPLRRMRVTHEDNDYQVTTIVTCAKEDPFAFKRAMIKLKEQRGLSKHAILVLIDAADDLNENDRQCIAIAKKHADIVLLGNHRDKRFNLEKLVKMAADNGILYDLLAPMDSDTICDHDWVIAELCDAFKDPKVGGSITSQRCLWVRNAIERDGDWLEDSRKLNSMSAGSLFGEILCLIGRLYMVRTALVVPQIYEISKEEWSGLKFSSSFPFIKKWRVKCKAGDDRWITNLILKQGYETVMVSSAGIKTIVPNTYRVLWKTWRRWGTSSQGYFYRTMLWLWRRPFAFYHALSDIYITHVSVYLVLSWIYNIFFGQEETLFSLSIMMALSLMGLMGTFILRQLPHLFKHPADFLLLPHFIAVVTIGQFVRLWAHYTPWMVGTWGTRGVDDEIGEVWIKRVK